MSQSGDLWCGWMGDRSPIHESILVDALSNPGHTLVLRTLSHRHPRSLMRCSIAYTGRHDVVSYRKQTTRWLLPLDTGATVTGVIEQLCLD